MLTGESIFHEHAKKWLVGTKEEFSKRRDYEVRMVMEQEARLAAQQSAWMAVSDPSHLNFNFILACL